MFGDCDLGVAEFAELADQRFAFVSRAAPELVFAMILHGAYNATVMSLRWPGLTF